MEGPKVVVCLVCCFEELSSARHYCWDSVIIIIIIRFLLIGEERKAVGLAATRFGHCRIQCQEGPGEWLTLGRC